MVKLLTDYTTQIYHALNTDARPDADPGAQLREIDTGKRFIFDGTSWNELPDGGGGGGGGVTIQAPYKVASGKYTPASNAYNASLPIAGSGITTIAAVYMECEDTVDYAVTYLSEAPVLLYLMYAYPHNIFGLGGTAGSDLTWLLTDGSLTSTGSFGGASTYPTVQNDTCYMKWTNGTAVKPGVTYNYIVLGV